MSKKNKTSLLISLLFVFAVFSSIYFYSKKTTDTNFNLSNEIQYKITSIDDHFYKINMIKKKMDGKSIYNIFLKDTIYSTSFLVKTRICESKNIFLISRYNNNVYSDIYKLKPLVNDLYISTYNSKNHLNFSHFEIHKKDIECIGPIYEVIKNKIPLTYKILLNEKIIYNHENAEKLNLFTDNFKILMQDKNLNISNNKISLNKNFGHQQNNNVARKSLFQEIYLRKVKKPFLIEDILLAKINGNAIKSLVISCKIVSGAVNFIVFDKFNHHVIEKVSCSNKKKIYIDIPRQKNLDFIISSQTFRMNSDEVSFRLYFNYIPI